MITGGGGCEIGKCSLLDGLLLEPLSILGGQEVMFKISPGFVSCGACILRFAVVKIQAHVENESEGSVEELLTREWLISNITHFLLGLLNLVDFEGRRRIPRL
jgi:hypothetical protein